MVNESHQGVGVPDVDQVFVQTCELLLKLSPLVWVSWQRPLGLEVSSPSRGGE